ncbi:uncharacterized protein LOC126739194 isoform X2 [Anthonomus grandis grandis]|uniref:uncharacterized protein LOC126739194 isoform X2 n=1 Tax=Anthonomus grandis grandis TaxID=2921223 RepID=UPI0021653B11|nr:uncharacterized protein LOC126739194 isoform X2 [Anthonomus grandis grandis]
MSEFTQNKVNKEPFESRVELLLRLAKTNTKTEESSAELLPRLSRPTDNDTICESIINENNLSLPSHLKKHFSGHEDNIILLPEDDLRGASKYIAELPLLPVDNCLNFDNAHSTFANNKPSTSGINRQLKKTLTENWSNKYIAKNTDSDSFYEDNDDSIADKDYQPSSLHILLTRHSSEDTENSNYENQNLSLTLKKKKS